MFHKYQVNVTRIVDGDTVDVEIDLGFHTFKKERLRLWGINAPERRGSSRLAGTAATEHLSKLIEEHGPVYIETIRHRDADKQGKYGRYLAVIYGRDGLNLNRQMVENGHAVTEEY
jgi:micrococcal nuclease